MNNKTIPLFLKAPIIFIFTILSLSLSGQTLSLGQCNEAGDQTYTFTATSSGLVIASAARPNCAICDFNIREISVVRLSDGVTLCTSSAAGGGTASCEFFAVIGSSYSIYAGDIGLANTRTCLSPGSATESIATGECKARGGSATYFYEWTAPGTAGSISVSIDGTSVTEYLRIYDGSTGAILCDKNGLNGANCDFIYQANNTYIIETSTDPVPIGDRNTCVFTHQGLTQGECNTSDDQTYLFTASSSELVVVTAARPPCTVCDANIREIQVVRISDGITMCSASAIGGNTAICEFFAIIGSDYTIYTGDIGVENTRTCLNPGSPTEVIATGECKSTEGESPYFYEWTAPGAAGMVTISIDGTSVTEFLKVYDAVTGALVCEQSGLFGTSCTFAYLPNRHYIIETDTDPVPIGDRSTCVSAGVKISPKVLLEGPYNAGTMMMNDQLRTAGSIPNTEPHTGLGFIQVNNTGGESVEDPGAIFGVTGQDAIIDWIFVELRDPADASVVLATRSGLLQSDGDIVDTDGISPLVFPNTLAGNYYLSVRHRNHLGVMTFTPIAVAEGGSTIDFSVTGTTIYGTGGRKDVAGKLLLWAGDPNSDGLINAADRSRTWNDRNLIGYLNADVNLDNTCNAGDRSITWNNRNKIAQLP